MRGIEIRKKHFSGFFFILTPSIPIKPKTKRPGLFGRQSYHNLTRSKTPGGASPAMQIPTKCLHCVSGLGKRKTLKINIE